MGISSPSLLTLHSLLLPISISLSLSHFLFCFILGERRSRRAPPPTKGDHVELHRHREVPDQVRPHQIWWDLAGSGENSPVLTGFWLDLVGFAAALPSTLPVLSNLYLLIFCFFFFLWLLWWVFFCGDLMMFDVWLIFYVCCCNGENPRNPTVTTRQSQSTDPPNPTTLMDGQRVGALQTRLSRVGQKNPSKPDPTPPLNGNFFFFFFIPLNLMHWDQAISQSKKLI